MLKSRRLEFEEEDIFEVRTGGERGEIGEKVVLNERNRRERCEERR